MTSRRLATPDFFEKNIENPPLSRRFEAFRAGSCLKRAHNERSSSQEGLPPARVRGELDSEAAEMLRSSHEASDASESGRKGRRLVMFEWNPSVLAKEQTCHSLFEKDFG